MRRFWLFVLGMIFCVMSATASSVLDKSISITAEGKSLKWVLEQIETVANVTFSYKSDVIDQDALVSLAEERMALRSVLQQILPMDKVGFNAVGTQIILYKHSVERAERAMEQIPDRKIPPITVYDTVRITDTVAIFDTNTVVAYDTVHVFDTTIVEKDRELQTEKKLSAFFAEIGYGFNYGLQTAQTINDSLYAGKEKAMLDNEVMLMWGVCKKNLSLKTGIGFCSVSQKVAYEQYNITTEQVMSTKYFYEATIDSVWMLAPGTDTVWIQQDDSVQKSITERYNVQHIDTAKVNKTNRAKYLSVPVYVSYTWHIRERMSVGIIGGVTSYINLGYNGSHVETTGKIAKNSANAVFLAGSMGARLAYTGSSGFSVALQPSIGMNITPMYSHKKEHTPWLGVQFFVGKHF